MYRLLVTFTSTLLVLTIFESVGASPYSRDIEKNYKTEPDYETGVKVAQWTKEMNTRPEELGNYFQGDIMIANNTKRNGRIDEHLRWPGGIIPYLITANNFTANQINIIIKAINEYHIKTCIRFKPRTNEKDYIDIKSGNTGCWSYVGRQGGRQEVNLQNPGCVYGTHTPIHEFMHAIGFEHEQTRDDRDNYVNIIWNNIPKNYQYAFAMNPKGTTFAYGEPYDYYSVIHYSLYAFAIDTKKKTIVLKKQADEKNIGNRNNLSNSDIKKIQRMYKC
ncbi:PREDICTED: astacin-like [Wasmannia auropunctata]|uniref:astacin-like n=1 Tax=Wasmannia auropunctata TaxID=64793 RepID=UPI0005ED70DF|nr:PREDICTED: astacin-like [Wasmannia auropunctata]